MTAFPDTLRDWRQRRRKSQLDLACDADVSARHISFLETGRARPSRDMVGRLGDALHLPLAARNQMLLAAGFAPRFGQNAWDADAMEPVRAAVDHMLASHAPYPALALDRLWTVVQMNAPAARLFGLAGVATGDSLLTMATSGRLADMVENWPEVAHLSAQRLRTESAALGGVPELDAAAALLSAVPPPATLSSGPVVSTVFRAGDVRLSLFATLAQFGTPQDLTLDALKVEFFFPADTDSATILRAMAAADTA